MTAFMRPRITSKSKTPGWTPGARVEADYYPTPPEAVRALLDAERFDGSIWEPACGNGAISRFLTAQGYFVVSTDLHDHGFGDPDLDFLKERSPRARHIVTNPPFGRGLADRFVEHALDLTAGTGGKVAMLLNLASLSQPSRSEWWRRNPPARIYALDHCECWDIVRFGPVPWRENTQRYAWMVWDTSHKGPTQFRWLTTLRKNFLKHPV